MAAALKATVSKDGFGGAPCPPLHPSQHLEPAALRGGRTQACHGPRVTGANARSTPSLLFLAKCPLPHARGMVVPEPQRIAERTGGGAGPKLAAPLPVAGSLLEARPCFHSFFHPRKKVSQLKAPPNANASPPPSVTEELLMRYSQPHHS